MAFHEVHVSRFTSPTTCYTGCRNEAGFFATETHSFHCSCQEDNDETTKVIGGPLPASREYCVGHDHCGSWELFAFLDPSYHHRRQDGNTTSASAAQETTMDNATVEASSDNVRPTSQSSIASSTSLPESTMDNPPTAQQKTGDGRPSSTIAWLVLQSSRKELAAAPTFTASLTFRPLTPLLTSPAPAPAAHLDQRDKTDVLAWLGSADDSKLRCYVAANHDELVPIELHDNVFSFDSPIMAMDSLSPQQQHDNNCHRIAIGCQDGTVRIISFQYQRTGENTLTFSALVAHTILIDGPIMALHLFQQHDEAATTRTHLVAGSMCGFVCRLETNDETLNIWEGPWMVAEGLRNTNLDSEDAVLAVHMVSDDMIAAGTHSGQCLVWQQRKEHERDSFRPLWKCKLPHPIHGLAHFNVASSGQPSLIVTTRYTIHVFERDVPKYCANIAKKRLMEMMARRQAKIDEDNVID